MNQIIKTYQAIETERQELKELHTNLVNSHADETLINGVFKQIMELTLKEGNILIPLERKA